MKPEEKEKKSFGRSIKHLAKTIQEHFYPYIEIRKELKEDEK